MKRLAAMQDWPLFRQRATAPTWAAACRSADGMTMNGSLPPSSSTTFLISSPARSEEHTSELQSLRHLVCRLLLEKKIHATRPLHHTTSPARKAPTTTRLHST